MTSVANLILLEYCEGGHLMSQIEGMCTAKRRFGRPELIVAFGQICNAVSYLHAQRPPVVHRDLKLENVLLKDGHYKLCDFGSSVIGHVPLGTARERADAEDVVQRTSHADVPCP